MDFPTKIDHFGVFLGVPPFKETTILTSKVSLCLLLSPFTAPTCAAANRRRQRTDVVRKRSRKVLRKASGEREAFWGWTVPAVDGSEILNNHLGWC